MLDQEINEQRRRQTAAQGENEKATSNRRPFFSEGENEKVAMAFDAENMLQALCKPWELGGHPHDFLVSHRSARSTDLYRHYERDKVLMQRHERLIAEKEAWKRQRELREDMLHLLTRLHSIEKQRRHFIDIRKQNHESDESGSARPDDIFKEEHADIKIGAMNLANTFFQKKQNFMSSAQVTGDSSLHTLLSTDGAAKGALQQETVSVETVAAMQEVRALDLFEEKLDNVFMNKKEVPAAAPGSAVSFSKKKKK
ncbi:hypothetical protein O6H91_19G051000 [Diphasiastrum complanatum]|uniref:Uncharacterized protein n=1 Tax=Diphasiastrum complanatum TaxID=34168 RepID=A0ACC2AV35_DIPCM|nr:hypothetical protein O6H91_19G051000 [Diphasiastrum complanatum]